MEFRILGPLEVLEDGRALELGGQKQRTLLAALLLNANEVVSQHRLLDALWEDEPPETAQKALQVYVSQLRKALGKERLQTKPPGYVLRIDQGELDLDRFRLLVEEGAFESALALWRGPPLADFSYRRFARAEIARLEELRLGTLEERIDGDLAAGRHAELVGELEALVGEHPLRERLRAQLMLAFYRSGRQAEALEAYQEARRALVEELGIDPGRELRELHQAILNQDPALDLEDIPQEAAVERLATSAAPSPVPGLKERKLVTVLFADLVGSTEIGENDPERFRLFLERFFEAMADEVQQAGGTVEKFAGGAGMAAFGAPTAHEDHAERALHAALAMQRRLE